MTRLRAMSWIASRAAYTRFDGDDDDVGPPYAVDHVGDACRDDVGSPGRSFTVGPEPVWLVFAGALRAPPRAPAWP
jgi:hypothetical protein